LFFFGTCGTTQALATYVNIGTIKDLIIKIFPKIVKFLFVHKGNKTVVGKLGNGGLKMIDIQSYFMSLKASWVNRLVSNQLVNWKVIPCKYFAKSFNSPHFVFAMLKFPYP
jgi:hypothetical protein